MRILVTGGAGAIGSHLVSRFLEAGDEVTVIDDLSSGRPELVPDGARLVVGSITDAAALDEAFSDRPARVAHLAALFANQNSVEHPVDDLMTNGRGTLMILDRSLRSDVAKVLVVSSSCVYPPADLLLEDEAGRSRDTPYAITKALAEDYAHFFAKQHGLDTVIVRPFNAYGPHEHPGTYRNVIPTFMAASIRGQPLYITGTGEETRDFTYVTDIAAGMDAALRMSTEPGQVFNLASGREVRIADLARLVNDLTGNRAGVELVPRRSWDATLSRRASITRAREVLGYDPSVAIEEGLSNTYDWFRTLDD